MQQAGNFIGEAFRRGDSGYETARRASCRNARLPDRYPDIIVQATGEKDESQPSVWQTPTAGR